MKYVKSMKIASMATIPNGVTDNNGSVKLSSINIAEYNARLYKTASSIRDVVNRQLKESNLFIDGTGVM